MAIFVCSSTELLVELDVATFEPITCRQCNIYLEPKHRDRYNFCCRIEHFPKAWKGANCCCQGRTAILPTLFLLTSQSCYWIRKLIDKMNVTENFKKESGTIWNTWDFKGQEEYVDQWFLMKSPTLMMIISIIYWSFVLKIGQKYMKNRPAFNITYVLVVYNAFQVIFSLYLLQIGINIIRSNGIFGSSCLMETEKSRYLITSSIYAYFFAKVTELLDTIFFVLRKKYDQVTFLHVYHHSVMMWGTWLTLKYEPSFSTIFLGTINSFVHAIMYSYYGLSSFPSLTKYLWWKKYITTMQLVQFVCVILHAGASTIYPGCPPSNTLKITIYFNGTLFLYLFGKFYINSYINSKKANFINADTIPSGNIGKTSKNE